MLFFVPVLGRQSSTNVEQRFAAELCDHSLFLRPDGLDREAVDEDPSEVTVTELANDTHANVCDLDWFETDDIYVLLGPALLDRKIGNQYRRTLRIVFERIEHDEHFPYDHVESAHRRAGWLTASLEDGGIRDPASIHRSHLPDVAENQRDLFCFRQFERRLQSSHRLTNRPASCSTNLGIKNDDINWLDDSDFG